MLSTQMNPSKLNADLLGRMHKVWSTISYAGVLVNQDTPNLYRKVVLTNRLSVIIFLIVFVQTIGFVAIGSPVATISWFLVLIVNVSCVPLLNFLGHRVTSRYIFSLALPLFAVIFSGHIRALYPETVHEGSFYISRYFQIALSFMPAILFGFEEKNHLITSFTINVVILLFYNQIMELMGAGLGVAEPVVKDPFFISVSSVLALAVISIGYFFLSKMNRAYEVQIEGLLGKVERQNESMQDAVNYAKGIQQVVLPLDDLLVKLDDVLFVMYKPLHTVSGDFYLVEETNDYILFSVVDCTGHGVPGAFMSILANSALKKSIELVGESKPEEILNKANRIFHEDLEKSGNPEIKDGMDIVMCSFDKKNNRLTAAGANLFIHVVENGSIVEHRTDKGAISIGNPDRSFNPLFIQLTEGAHVYLSSDGFYDQFGGESNKRIGRRRYRQKLEQVSSLPLKEQLKALDSFFTIWKGNHSQIDDVCLIGFRC